MKVYEGMLRGNSGRGSWPRSWLVLTAQPSQAAQSQGSGLRRSVLASWSALVICRTASGHMPPVAVSGDTVSDFWTCVNVWISEPGPHWIVSEYGIREWTLLGVWPQLMTGAIKVSDSGPIRRRAQHDRGLGREPGLLMTGDPPTAGRFELADIPTPFHWVSARNYGYIPPDDSVNLRDRCTRLADWLQHVDAALHEAMIPGWRPTLGGMAWSGWQATYQDAPIYRSRHALVTGLESAARAGGVQIAARPGGKWQRCYHLDARGLYSWIAAHMPLPTGADWSTARGEILPAGLTVTDASTLARVDLAAGMGQYPVREHDRVRWPVGPCTAVLCGPELASARADGLVGQVHQAVYYAMGAPLEQYQRRVYALRCAAEQAGQSDVAALCKGLGVAIVGKFAGRSELWEECIPDYNDPLFGRWWSQDEKGRPTVYEATPAGVARCRYVGDSWSAVPCIALWVWSAGRRWMWDRILTAGREAVIYAHTDGMIVTEGGALALEEAGMIRDQEWGQLRRLDGPVRVECRPDGVLQVGERMIAPGVPLRARESLEELCGGNWFRVPTTQAPGDYLAGRIPESMRRTGSGGIADDIKD